MPHSKPTSELKDGDKFVDEYGEFRVVKPDSLGCRGCDHMPYPCDDMGCGLNDFSLLTQINYITHRLTK